MFIVDHEVVVDFGQWLVARKDLKHSLTDPWVDLLAVASLTDRFVLVHWILNMDELSVGNVLDKEPFEADGSCPLALLLPK